MIINDMIIINYHKKMDYFIKLHYTNQYAFVKTVKPCYFCNRIKDPGYHLPGSNKAICKIGYKQVSQYLEQLWLIDIVMNDLVLDIKKLIYKNINDINYVNCIMIKIQQDKYLNFYFNDFDVLDLKTLILQRGLVCPSNNRVISHLVVLQNDVKEKELLWRGKPKISSFYETYYEQLYEPL